MPSDFDVQGLMDCGGEAFPIPGTQDMPAEQGMAMIDFFATSAMEAMCQVSMIDMHADERGDIAHAAYMQAVEMVKMRRIVHDAIWANSKARAAELHKERTNSQ